jgi:predicted secreted protein
MKREAEKQWREKLKRMTPAEQAKYEEKQRKKEEQRMKSKFVKVMK